MLSFTDPKKIDRCSYEEYYNQTLKHVEYTFRNLTKDEVSKTSSFQIYLLYVYSTCVIRRLITYNQFIVYTYFISIDSMSRQDC